MRIIAFTLTALFLSLYNNSAHAQWTSFTLQNSPIAWDVSVQHVAADYNNKQVFVLTYDTSYHLHKYHEQNGWTSYPQYDELFDSITMVSDTKARNGKLWCLTPSGLIWFENNNMGIVKYPANYVTGINGMVVLNDNSVWFAGGVNGYGITHYHPQRGWGMVNHYSHPEFVQDIDISDLKMDEKDSVLWIGTNCFTQNSGVYSYHIKTNQLVKYNNGENKYRCVHAVEPANGKVFVGTANFSSLRILNNAGVYTQSLDRPIIPWITEMRIDPSDSTRVWALTDMDLVLFKDTLTYTKFTPANTPLRGYVYELSLQNITDSMQVWIGTSAGLYRYTYRTQQQPTGINEREEAASFVLYPNPASTQVTINCESGLIDRVSVTDLTGRTVLSTEAGRKKQVTLKTGELPAGIYTVLIHDENTVSAQKLVLTR